MADPLDRFTVQARQVFKNAQEEALRLNHNYIGTEHLLLGMLDPACKTIAATLSSLRIDPNQVRARVHQTVGLGERKPFGKPQVAPRVKVCIELAAKLVNQLEQVGQRYIAPEHLFLGMVEEGEGVGVRVLQEFVQLDDLVAAFIEVLTHIAPNLAVQFAGKDRWNWSMVKIRGKEYPIRAIGFSLLDISAALSAASAGFSTKQSRDDAIQEERTRLARELHDSIKQQLFSISISAAAARERLTSDLEGARAALDDVHQSAQAAMSEMNAMLQQLSPTPLAGAGLIDALRQQCEALAYRTDAEVTTLFGDLPPIEQLPDGAHEHLFRIAQEALSNIARHARAGRVHLRLETLPDSSLVRLEIRDDGQGFDPAKTPNGMGLVNMQARAVELSGELRIESRVGEGTVLQVEIPIPRQGDKEMGKQGDRERADEPEA